MKEIEKDLENSDINHTVLSKARKITLFFIVALSLLMTTVDTTIVATALDTLQKELHTTVNWIGWTLTAYSLGFVLMLPLSAKLSQQYGPKRIFLASVITFTLTSFACGMVNHVSLLIALRVVQAIGAAGITPSVTAIIVNHFGDSRDRAVSLFGSIFPIGVMLGPIFGGLIVTYWSWEWIFFVNVPFGIIAVLMGFKLIPKDLPEKIKSKEKMDKGGILWLAIGILASMFAATYLGEENTSWLSWAFLSLTLVGIVGFVGFILHINKVKEPFIKPRFVYGQGFGTVNFLNVLFAGVTMGVIALVPLYAANRYGLSALDSGTLLIAQGGASVILSTVMTMLLRKTGYRLPLYIGCSIIMLGTALLAVKPQFGFSPYVWLMSTTFLIGIGMGIISPPARNAGLQLAPEESATIAALRSLGLQLGSIISIAIATAVIAAAEMPGAVQAHVYIGVAVLFLVCIPSIKFIPEHKGAW